MDYLACNFHSLKGSSKDLTNLIQQIIDENPDRKFITIYPKNWLEDNCWEVLCKEAKKNE